ncbi:MAG: hypothetical protein HeimC3_46700 [Candidatus Heimdallarchaeota archaeon LC_3]|nr:MAG: hypothetical protein HeimC3_46700 [Candidatus Heimdallarchaeota archaeon LC_3]
MEQVTETKEILDDIISSDLDIIFSMLLPIYILSYYNEKEKKNKLLFLRIDALSRRANVHC